jgi:lipopolysaccharide/colanic/teichoic acid biosynthesis glycosyltransferase
VVSTVLPLTTRPASAQFVLSALMKRTFDIVVSLTGIVLFSPLLILVAMLIKASSPGPVFYLGSRAGRRGTPFDIWKFRTMIVDAEAVGGSATASDDPRITRIGRVLRKHKVDELPQLLNVLRGDMSFVGPRPEVTDYVDLRTRRWRKSWKSSRASRIGRPSGIAMKAALSQDSPTRSVSISTSSGQ